MRRSSAEGVGGATGARLAELGFGQGFASWCGASDGFLGSVTTTDTPLAAATAAYEAAKAKDDAAHTDATAEALTAAATKLARLQAAKAPTAPSADSTGINPGDPCTNKDGTSGTIKTPGSTIVATLNKVLGGQQDQVVRMGNVGGEINKILGNIATVIKTVDFATKILGGPGSGGLFGVDTPTGANQVSPLRQYTNQPGNLGVTNSGVYKTAATLPSSGPDMLNRVALYGDGVE